MRLSIVAAINILWGALGSVVAGHVSQGLADMGKRREILKEAKRELASSRYPLSTRELAKLLEEPWFVELIADPERPGHTERLSVVEESEVERWFGMFDSDAAREQALTAVVGAVWRASLRSLDLSDIAVLSAVSTIDEAVLSLLNIGLDTYDEVSGVRSQLDQLSLEVEEIRNAFTGFALSSGAGSPGETLDLLAHSARSNLGGLKASIELCSEYAEAGRPESVIVETQRAYRGAERLEQQLEALAIRTSLLLPSVNSLVPTVEWAREVVLASTPAHGHAIVLTCDDEASGQALISTRLLRYTLVEVLRNALEWGADHAGQADVRVLVTNSERRSVVDVKDHGVGFPSPPESVLHGVRSPGALKRRPAGGGTLPLIARLLAVFGADLRLYNHDGGGGVQLKFLDGGLG